MRRYSQTEAYKTLNVSGPYENWEESTMFERKWLQSRATLLHAQLRTLTFCFSMATIYLQCAVIYIFTRKVSDWLSIYQNHIPQTSLGECWGVIGITDFVAFSTTELKLEKYRTPLSRFYPSEIIDHTCRKMKTDCPCSTIMQLHCCAKECKTKQSIVTVWQTNSRRISTRT